MFMGEVSGILSDVNPQRVYLMWCDAKLHRVDEVEDVSDLLWVREKGAPGGGGTSFVPVFDHVHELPTGVDALVYLTDGYGTFPHKEPEYPVLWGSIGLQPEHYPWGEVVMIPRVQ